MTAQPTSPSTTSAKPRFSRETTVGDALKAHPQTKMVFASFHLGGCSHCGINEADTLEAIATQYGIPLEFMLSSLNSLPAQPAA